MSELTRDEKAELVAGAGFWRTLEIPHAGIRSIVVSDGPHGVRLLAGGGGDNLGLGEGVPATCFPPAAGIASSWNPGLIERVGEALGLEARSAGVGVLLGPGVNIKRSPLCGRNFEYFSEDPWLSGVLGAAWVRGLQSQGVGASVKHFAANNQETNRMTVSAEVDERTLRELYLPAFEHIVTTEEPWTVMCSYNRINGVYAAENRWLLTKVLREEWGFEGLVISDWGAVDNRVAALAAGTDLEMPGPQPISKAAILASGADLDPSVERIIALAAKLSDSTLDYDEDAHHALAREAAIESIVLLRNESAVLPIAPDARVVVFGEFARTPRFQGAGSSQVTPTRVDAVLDFLPGAVFGTEPTEAADADVALVFAGLPASAESEGFDRVDLELPASDVELILAVAAVNPRTVVVLTNGGVLSLEPWHDAVTGIVEGWLLGQAGGSALAAVLLGEVSPSGRLAETIPFRLEDNPAYLNFPGDLNVVRYGEGVFVGYRHYESIGRPVRYPFGYGLTYGSFEYRGFSATANSEAGATATVSVMNTGAVAAADVVQVYVAGPGIRPARVLGGFKKVALQSGEETTVTIPIPQRAFEHWDLDQSSWQLGGSEYTLALGRSARDIEAVASVTLSAPTKGPLSLDSSVTEWLEHPVTGPLFRRMARNAVEGDASALQMVGSMPIRRLLRFPGAPMNEKQLEQLAGLANNRAVRGVARLFSR